MTQTNMRFYFFILPVLLLIPFLSTKQVKAQVSIQDSTIKVILLSANYSLEKPGEDLNKRFGLSHFIGPSVGLKTQSNWLFSVEYGFLFGNDVKQNPLTFLETDDGNIINGQGTMEPLVLRQRGFRAQVKAGKVFPWIGANPNSGIFFQVGAGMLQHRIDYKTPSGSVFQLKGDYEKGYDRLTNGFSLTETLGYLNLSNSRLVNFTVAFQVTQAFTKNRRDWNFDTKSPMNDNRLDMLYGIRIEWTFPLYKQASKGFFYR